MDKPRTTEQWYSYLLCTEDPMEALGAGTYKSSDTGTYKENVHP